MEQRLSNDLAIRTKLLGQFTKRYSNKEDVVIVEELGLHHGYSRIDIAVLNNCFHGFEIKSDMDTLTRLPEQIKVYNNVFDEVTLVVGYKLAYDALNMIPRWWGVKLVDVGKRGGIYITEARRPQQNPSPNALSLVKLLWRSEAMTLLPIETQMDSKYRNKAQLYNEIVDLYNREFIKKEVLAAIRNRLNVKSVSL